MSGIKLNLGCGQFPKEGYINIDIDRASRADFICDLARPPYPFRDGSVESIVAEHVLEHMENPFEVMKELRRIMKPGGELIIKVPHFTRAFTHPDHKRGFDVSFPYYFSPEFKGGYAQVEFELKSLRLKWFAQEDLKREILSPAVYFISLAAGKVFDFFANLCPSFCSRIWSYWVGGFEEIEFLFTKPK